MRRGCSSQLRWFLAVAAFVANVAFSLAGSAQDSEPTPADIKQAARAFDVAKEAYGSEDYKTAADQFEKADGHAPSPVALQWAIESHHQAGHAARAATLAALAKQRHADVPELTELAARVISETEAELLEVQVVCEEPCELFVDNKIVHGRPALTRTLYLDPGEYTLQASFGADRRGEPQQVSGVADDTASVLFAPPALGGRGNGEEASLEGMEDPFAEEPAEEDPFVDTEPRAEPSSGWSPTVFWVGASLTAVSGVVTTWSGLDTLNNPGTDVVKEECKGQGTECEAYQDGLKRQKRTNILLGVTGGLAVFTVVAAIFTDWSDAAPAESQLARRSRPRNASFSVEPWISVGQGAALGATGRF